jgi:phosphoribosylglycinamide formyltransferase 1
MSRLALGVLVSGSGTNLGAILGAIADKRLDAELKLVISNKPDVVALERATAAGVPTCVISHKSFGTREEFDGALADQLERADVDYVVLAGFMRVLTPTFLERFPGRVVNIHPALLPAFPGVDAQRQAYEYGVKVTGCTVHFVDHGTDTGPIIAQRVVPRLDDDSIEDLRARILEQEHLLLVESLQALAEGRVTVEPVTGSRARVRVRSL